MKEFSFWMPTKVIMDKNCLLKHGEELRALGKKALLVTGKQSAVKSGALEDLIEVLEKQGVRYVIYNEVEENPSLETVETAGCLARSEEVDFIIGVGGGSPLDASKAIAALATNAIPSKELFSTKLTAALLPIVAIPTTAGTGSEVTQYAILTDHSMETKRNFSSNETYPTLALLDAKYTESLPLTVTVNTAIDFLSHAVEGFLSRRSTPITDALALEVFIKFKQCFEALATGQLNGEIRQELLYASTLAGVIISQTGTCMVHALGYPLTYYGNIPHGRANGLLMTEFLRFNHAAATAKINLLLGSLGLSSISKFEKLINSLLGEKNAFSHKELAKFAKASLLSASINFTPIIPTEGDLLNILVRSGLQR